MATKTTKAKVVLTADQLPQKRQELLEAKKSLHAGTLQNPHHIRAIKKDIARIMTQVNQKESK